MHLSLLVPSADSECVRSSELTVVVDDDGGEEHSRRWWRQGRRL